MAITWEDVSISVECPMRVIDQEIYDDWLMCAEQEEDASKKGDLDDFDEVFALQTRILIPDEGPGQRQHQMGDRYLLPVNICNACYPKVSTFDFEVAAEVAASAEEDAEEDAEEA